MAQKQRFWFLTGHVLGRDKTEICRDFPQYLQAKARVRSSMRSHLLSSHLLQFHWEWSSSHTIRR